ncbi:membrane protein [Fusobacterium necrophorum BL]|uniref:Membrane protein n=1 Tax=Fusobacterium necrophorum BL TaxID=1441732 RepID=A0AB73BZG7_9FUSO|nr:membrane protein [Fusobacterium necrophorum BL]
MLKRELGSEQPSWKLGVFRVRLPFVHYRFESSEALQAILMCATCLGAIPILTSVLGIPFELAWSMVIINGLLYNTHALLGDPVVPGWITPSIPLTIAYLTQFEMGPVRIQALIALQLLVAFTFLFMGITGLAGKLMRIVPDSIKSGILLGAGFAAIIGEFAVEKGRFNLYPFSIAIGTLLSYFLLFSERFKEMRKNHALVNLFGKYGMLPAIFASIIIAPLCKELPFPNIEVGSFIKIPEFSNILRQVSVFGVGFPNIDLFVKAIPMAIMVYIIAFGDFVTSGALLKEADRVRTDEKIDFNSNRSNLISGIRNLIQGILIPYVPLCGPLWAAVSAAVFERYKEGREGMDSVYSGVGTFRWMTFICVSIVPIVSLVQPTLPVALSLTLLVQGFVCTRLAMTICKDHIDMGIAGVMAAVIAVKGAAWGLGVGIILFLLLVRIKERKIELMEEV